MSNKSGVGVRCLQKKIINVILMMSLNIEVKEMKCPNCEKQNKPGVKNCEYCNEKMPVRKKNPSKSKKDTAVKQVTEDKKTKTVKKTNESEVETKKVVKEQSKKTVKEEIKKEPLIELSDEKKALKKMVKNVKNINKMIYVYILFVISISLREGIMSPSQKYLQPSDSKKSYTA
jgi:hypothetical protein